MDSARALAPLRDRKRRGIVGFLLYLAGTVSAPALDIDDLTITTQDRIYETHMTFSVAAPVSQVKTVLTDYGFPDRLNADITGKEIISRENGITRVRMEARSCVLFFCKTITLVQDVTIVANTISADVVPDDSDFRSGYLRWSISSDESGGSRISFESIMEPDFLVPPLIGGYFARKKLRRELLTTARNLETEAARESTLE